MQTVIKARTDKDYWSNWRLFPDVIEIVKGKAISQYAVYVTESLKALIKLDSAFQPDGDLFKWMQKRGCSFKSKP
jgi:hypothetical protein